MTNNLTDPRVQARVHDLAAAATPHGITVYTEAIPVYPDRQRLHIGVERPDFWRPLYWTDELTDEHLTDLIAYFSNRPVDLEDSVNIYSTDLFTYLAGDMIGQATIALTISGVTLESMNSGKGGAQTKPCLHFKERNKLMVLNKTNAKTIAAILGPETENWVGARVTIGTAMVDAFGKTTRSLRIVDVQPEKIVAAKPRPANGKTEPSTPLTYGDGSHVAPSALDGYRAYMAANDGQPPADVRALLAWQQGEPAQDDLFGQDPAREAALATAQGTMN